MLIHLLRHGLTACNAQGRVCGRRCDAELDATGLAMASVIGERLADEGYRRIIVSPQARARQTAEPLAERLGLEPVVDARLAEAEVGEWEGRLLAELQSDSRYRAYLDDAETCPPPGGEPPSAIYARTRAVLEELAAPGPVLIVSHKTTLRVLLAGLLGLPLRDFRRSLPQPSGALTTVRATRSGFAVGAIASIEHLPPRLRVLG